MQVVMDVHQLYDRYDANADSSRRRQRKRKDWFRDDVGCSSERRTSKPTVVVGGGERCSEVDGSTLHTH